MLERANKFIKGVESAIKNPKKTNSKQVEGTEDVESIINEEVNDIKEEKNEEEVKENTEDLSSSNLDYANKFIKDMEDAIKNPRKVDPNEKLKVGVDLGTANIVLTVLDSKDKPVAGSIYPAKVVRDGIVVEYMKAIDIVRKLKADMEKTLGRSLDYAAAAIPPGISDGNTKVISNVVEASGFEVTNIVDEPTAAAKVLGIKSGAVVDIGGGTTGISILKDGEVIYSADEATGGHHLNLVIAGGLNMQYEEAEKFKMDAKNYDMVFPIVRPVIEKMANIISRSISEFDVGEIYLVGGTCCLKDIEKVIAKYNSLPTIKPYDPLLVTPIGIAMSNL